jgi:hypothetical protein
MTCKPCEAEARMKPGCRLQESPKQPFGALALLVATAPVRVVKIRVPRELAAARGIGLCSAKTDEPTNEY